MTPSDSVLYRKVPDFFALLVVALVVYIPLLFFVVSLGSEQVRAGEGPRFVYPVHGSDSAGYVVLADNILEQRVFSSSNAAPFLPDTFRTPGYPFFLALFKFIFGSYTWFPLIQILCTVGVSFMVLRMGERVFSRTVGMVGAFLYLLDPTVILHSLVLLSDSTYVFLVVLTVYLLFFKSKEGSVRERAMVVGAAGVVLGISVLARPISMFLPAVLLPFYIFSVRADLPKKKIAQNILLFIFGLSILTVPWLMRNKNAVGVWGLSSVASFNLFFYYVPEFLAYDRQTSPDVERARMQAELPTYVPPSDIALLENAKTINAISLKYLDGHAVGYTKFHLVKTIPVFLSSGMKHIFYYYNALIQYPAFSLSNANMTTLLLKGEFTAFFKELRVSFIPTVESLYLFVITILAFLALLFNRRNFFCYLFWALILYFALLTGSVAYSRFRLPFAPFLFLLGSFGATIVWQKGRELFGRFFNFTQ